MDGRVRVLHPFNIISVISRRWKGEYERLCAMKRHLGLGRISPPVGFEPATPFFYPKSGALTAQPRGRFIKKKKHNALQRSEGCSQYTYEWPCLPESMTLWHFKPPLLILTLQEQFLPPALQIRIHFQTLSFLPLKVQRTVAIHFPCKG